jgi:hypothetical protein
VDALRRPEAPMTAHDLAAVLVAGRTPPASRKQLRVLQAAILAALRKHNGGAVVGEGTPARWRPASF